MSTPAAFGQTRLATAAPQSGVAAPKKRSQGSRQSLGPKFWNSVLLALAVLAGGYWVDQHGRHYYAASRFWPAVIAGAMVALPLITRMSWPVVGRIKTWFNERILGQSAITAWLVALVVIMVVANLATTSFWIESDAGLVAQVERVDGAGTSTELKAARAEGVAGRLFFSGFRGQALAVTLVQPMESEAASVRVVPGVGRVLRAPEDFSRKRSRVVWLVASPWLLSQLPEAAGAAGRGTLELWMEHAGRSERIVALLTKGIWVVGPSTGAIAEAETRLRTAEGQSQLRGLARAATADETEVQELLDGWSAQSLVVVVAPAIGVGQVARFVVRRPGETSPVAEAIVTFEGNDEIESILFQRPPIR